MAIYEFPRSPPPFRETPMVRAREMIEDARLRIEAGRTVLFCDGPGGFGCSAVDRRGVRFAEYTHRGLFENFHFIDRFEAGHDFGSSVEAIASWEQHLVAAMSGTDTIEWRIEPEIAFEGGGWKVYSRLSFWKASDPK